MCIRDSIVRQGITTNRWVLLAVAGGLALQVLMTVFPPAAAVLGMQGLVVDALPVILGAALVPVSVAEISKWWSHRGAAPPGAP